MKEAGDRKSLVQSVDSGSHSTNISFFLSFLQTPTLHAASRMGTEPYMPIGLKEGV